MSTHVHACMLMYSWITQGIKYHDPCHTSCFFNAISSILLGCTYILDQQRYMGNFGRYSVLRSGFFHLEFQVTKTSELSDDELNQRLFKAIKMHVGENASTPGVVHPAVSDGPEAAPAFVHPAAPVVSNQVVQMLIKQHQLFLLYLNQFLQWYVQLHLNKLPQLCPKQHEQFQGCPYNCARGLDGWMVLQ